MSPRTQQQYEGIREEKRALIMEKALKCFALDGYHSTTISTIASAAGISKGLMYNYFESKEELLSAIIKKSIDDVYGFFDQNRDGYLTEDEFEFFIRRITLILKEKKMFWRLFFQLMMQNEVREQFLRTFVGSSSLFGAAMNPNGDFFVATILKSISEYFIRKKSGRGDAYDPLLELNMFILTMKGFAVTYIYTDNLNDEYFNSTVERIISTYK